MSAVDFDAWACPDLTLTLRGRTYTVRPPSVADMRQVLALAVRAEAGRDRTPPEVLAILDGLPSDGHPALGDAYGAMVADGQDPTTIDRVGVYATLFWARGREYADHVAQAIWGPEAGGGGPKARRPSQRRSGPAGTGPSTA